MIGGRTDRNHAEIRDALRKVAHPVYDTSHIGGGFPDLMVRHRLGRVVFIEIKDGELSPSRRKLTAKELEFQRLWTTDYEVVTSVEEAYRAVGYAVRIPAQRSPAQPPGPKP